MFSLFRIHVFCRLVVGKTVQDEYKHLSRLGSGYAFML
jgi:hypothetical protein